MLEALVEVQFFGRKFNSDLFNFTGAYKMFPSHLSVNDVGGFAVCMVLGLMMVLLFMFDFVSKPGLL